MLLASQFSLAAVNPVAEAVRTFCFEFSWGALKVVGVLVVCVIICRLRTALCCRGWKVIQLPPRKRRWFLGRLKRRLLGRESQRTKSLICGVRQSDRFGLNLERALRLLGRQTRFFRFIGMSPRLRKSLRVLSVEDVEQELDSLLSQAIFCRQCAFPPVGGYASWLDESRNTAIVGLERPVASVPLVAPRAASHELIHCVQHVCGALFDLEWSECGLTRWESLYIEFHAHVSASLSLLVGFPTMAVWLIILMVVT